MDINHSEFYIDGQVCADTYFYYNDIEIGLINCEDEMRKSYLSLQKRDWSGKGKDSFDENFKSFLESMNDVYALLEQVQNTLIDLVDSHNTLLEQSKNFVLINRGLMK